MKAKLTPDDPGSFTYTLHISYTLAQWGLICEALADNGNAWVYPMADLVAAIEEVTRLASRNFAPTPNL